MVIIFIYIFNIYLKNNSARYFYLLGSQLVEDFFLTIYLLPVDNAISFWVQLRSYMIEK
jgi:hypothetical protein